MELNTDKDLIYHIFIFPTLFDVLIGGKMSWLFCLCRAVSHLVQLPLLFGHRLFINYIFFKIYVYYIYSSVTVSKSKGASIFLKSRLENNLYNTNQFLQRYKFILVLRHLLSWRMPVLDHLIFMISDLS